MKQKSLKLNMLLNSIKGLMAVLFPLITFPYVSKVLGVNALGEYNFATSIISYILLIAGLGVNSYAIREGARIREDKEKFSRFANEMFSINVISTIFSYIVLIILLLSVPKFNNYIFLILVLSLQVAVTVLGVNWIYSIFEDYTYITIRSIVFQFISVCLMFILIKSEKDLLMYAFITVMANAGSNIFDYFYAKKYCKVRFILKINWKKHIKPILILFGMAATISVYVNSDITILGFLCDDYSVGIYSVSAKVASVIKSLLSSIIVVSIPRLSSLLSDDDISTNFKNQANSIYNMLNSFVIPAIVGLVILREEVVLIISDMSYLSATISVMILCITTFFSLGAYFWGQAVLIPLKRENTVFYATIVSAIVNILLNFVLIPIGRENAAAFTTLIAEAIVFMWCIIACKNIFSWTKNLISLFKIFVGCIGIIISNLIISSLAINQVFYVILTILISIVVYIVIEILVKNETITDIFSLIKRKFDIFISSKKTSNK